MNKNRRLKLISALSVIPLLVLLGLFLFTEQNIEILRRVFTHELTNDEIQLHLRALGIRGYITVALLSMLQIVIAVLPAEPVQVLAGLAFGFGRSIYTSADGCFGE